MRSPLSCDDARVTDDIQRHDEDLLDTSHFRFSDTQALWLLGTYLAFRFVTQRFGLGSLAWLLEHAPWAIPLLNNSTITMVTAGTEVRDQPAMWIATGAGSILLSMVAGMILYWAGWRFGPGLTERAERTGSFWSQVWNPKQVAKAHGWIERWGVFAVLLARGAVEWMLAPVALVAGLSRMSLRKYLPALGTGAVIYAGLTLWLGGRAGDQWPWLPDRIKSFATWSLWIGIGLTVLIVLLVVVAQRGDRATAAAGDPPTDEA